MSARNVELEAALLNDRDDARQWAVYGDWLEVNGDPRGALVSLMLSRESRPSVALSEALKANAQLVADLTPEPLKTLATRGYPRLAPVWRRGFIQSAGAADASDFAALLEHPSCALLDRALLKTSAEALNGWLGGVSTPVPWRSVEVSIDETGAALSLARLFELAPRLEHLALDFRREPGSLELAPASALRRLTVTGPTPAIVTAIAGARLPSLSAIELRLTGYEPDGRELDELVTALLPRWSSLEEVIVEGAIGDATRRACTQAKRPARLLVRSTGATQDEFAVPRPLEMETAFVVLNRELTAADQQAITDFAKLAGVPRLVLVSRTVRLGGRTVALLCLRGEGDAPIVPRVAAQQLAKRDRSLDAVALSVSGSNDATSAWSFGPHVLRGEPKKNTIPTARRDEGRYTRSQMAREVLDAMLGFDPGLDALDELAAALELGTAAALIGEAPSRLSQLPLFTELLAREEEPELDDYDEAESTDALDQDGEDDDSRDYDDGYEFTPDAWGGEPLDVPDYGPPEPAPAPAAAKVEVIVEDDPADDLDAPTFDAWSADPEEIWKEGPVDTPEHHNAPIGEEFSYEEVEMPLVSFEASLVPCAHCGQLRELQRCASCRDEVCRGCAGVQSAAAWDDAREFTCDECSTLLVPERRAQPGVEGPASPATRAQR